MLRIRLAAAVARRRSSARIWLPGLSAETQFSVVAIELVLAEQAVVVAKQGLFARDQLLNDRPDVWIVTGQVPQLVDPAAVAIDRIEYYGVPHGEGDLQRFLHLVLRGLGAQRGQERLGEIEECLGDFPVRELCAGFGVPAGPSGVLLLRPEYG